MNLPESREEQIAWLESEMVGTELVSLVTELQTVHDAPAQNWSIEQWPATTRDAIRDSGLATLDETEFQLLLTEPMRLLAIQRDVLQYGGQHWNHAFTRTELQSNKRLAATHAVLLAKKSSTDATITPASNRQSLATPTPTNSFWSGATWAMVGSLATAAALLWMTHPDPPTTNSPINNGPATSIAVTPNTQPPDVQPITGWGFEKFAARLSATDGDLARLDRETYLRELAAAADTWSSKKPETAQALAQRIGEFRMGCSAILMASHASLSDPDREWLRTRCRSWASALDRHLSAIESGQDIETVRQQVDSTATKISAALVGRAETPA